VSTHDPKGPPRAADGNAPAKGTVPGRAVAWLGWWVVLMAFWVITDDSIGLDELLAGAGAAALGALLAEVAAHQASVSFGIRFAWLRRAAGLPRQVLAETGIVFAALWRKLAHGQDPRSGFVAEPARYGPDTPDGRMRRALLVGARSLSPNSFVLGIDRDRNLMVMHKLVLDDREPRS
jgi:multisubunit Na+/H+ antiporter MnhE subunit